MTYNFDEIIDRRHTNALNTDGFRGYIFHAGPEKVFAFKDEEFVRMWVADMEFAVAPEILDALRARIDRRIFGYTGLYDDEYYRTFSKWCRDHYDWSFPKEQLCVSPGIIPALYQLTETLCGPDEKVLLNTPAYGYFLHSAEYAGVGVLQSPLKKKPDGTFELDYENFEQQCANPQCKMVFWCNPQNPTGRMWTEEELRRIAGIVEKYNLWSTYTPEDKGVMIAYASIYGNTENAAEILASKLRERGVRTAMYDVSVTPASDIIAECFRWSHLVFASATYNGGIFVTMDELLRDIAAHNLQKRTVAFMENGTWAPVSARQMAAILAPLKNMTVLEQSVAIRSSLTEGQLAEIEALADVIAEGIR